MEWSIAIDEPSSLAQVAIDGLLELTSAVIPEPEKLRSWGP